MVISGKNSFPLGRKNCNWRVYSPTQREAIFLPSIPNYFWRQQLTMYSHVLFSLICCNLSFPKPVIQPLENYTSCQKLRLFMPWPNCEKLLYMNSSQTSTFLSIRLDTGSLSLWKCGYMYCVWAVNLRLLFYRGFESSQDHKLFPLSNIFFNSLINQAN